MTMQPLVEKTNIQEQSIAEIKAAAHGFSELLSLEYGVPVKFHVHIVMEGDVKDKINTVLKTVSEYYSVPLEKLTKKGRKRPVIEARQIAIDFIHRVYGLTSSLKQTGLIFGGQDHSTIIHAKKTVADLRESSKEYAKHYNNVASILETSLGTP